MIFLSSRKIFLYIKRPDGLGFRGSAVDGCRGRRPRRPAGLPGQYRNSCGPSRTPAPTNGAPIFEVWRGEDRQILPPPVYGKHNGVMPFGLQNMSLRGAKRRGNPFPFPVYGFPRQCEHWLGMTGLAESSAPTLLSPLPSPPGASRPVLGPTHCGAGPFSGASASFSPRAPLSPAAPALFSPGCTGPC